jgi:hypothetical protein
MGARGPIYVDAEQPAALRHAGVSTDCPTLQEAVVAWQKLPKTLRKSTTIVLTGAGTVYQAAEIERLQFGPKPGASAAGRAWRTTK